MAFGHHPPRAPDDMDDMMMSFIVRDAHPEVTDELLGFVYDPIDDLLNLEAEHQHCAKKPRAHRTDDDVAAFMVGPVQLFVSGGPDAGTTTGVEGRSRQRVQSAAARERRSRIRAKTAQLSRLIPGGHKLSTAEMLEEAARHLKVLQAQVGILALMHAQTQNAKVPVVAQEQMHALLGCGRVQERLAAERKCLVPRKLVDAVAGDKDVASNALVNRDLSRFMASLDQ